jgi:NADH-ubiquinone oxidoreductase chain 1
MISLHTVFSLVEVLLLVLPVLLSVAFITIIERKVLASIQRRVGPNVVGWYGTLQPFSDALKLIIKENLIPQHSNKALFFLAPLISLICSILGWGVIPFANGLSLVDFSLGVLYTIALSSIGVYGILLAGWSANSKYAFIGSLSSAAQIVSYELVLSSAVLGVIFVTGSFSWTIILENQQSIWFLIPLFPLFVIFFISALAETNRTPFDLPEAESELVAGFFTEHASIVFVMFFLAEYCSIVLISALTALLFFGGYLIPFIPILSSLIFSSDQVLNTIISLDLFYGIEAISLAIKTSLFCFAFVWFRATLPRQRYDALMVFAWTGLLPIVVALLLLLLSFLVGFDAYAV